MILMTSRALNESEKAYLQKESIFLKNIIRRVRRFNFLSPVVLLIGLKIVSYMAHQHKDIALLILAIVVTIIFSAIIVWSNHDIIKAEKNKLNDVEELILKNRVEVAHCQSKEMVVIRDIGKEELGYGFKAEESKIFFLRGRDLLEKRDFPNSDFEVAVAYGIDKKRTVLFNLYTYGERVVPLKIISLGRKMSIPKGGMTIVDGRLEDIENILSRKKVR